MKERFVILFIIAIIFSFSDCHTESLCLERKESIKWKRHFHVDNQTLPIIIDVSNRRSHRIISFVLKILIIERVHYTNVIFKEIPWLSPTETMQRLHSKKNLSFPDAHINLELWQPPGFNVEAWVNKGYVLDCGPLGPIARRGIFTPSITADQVFETYNESVDHWRIFESLSKNWNYSELYKWLTVNKSWIALDNYSPKDVINTPIILIDNKDLFLPLKKLFGSIFTRNLSNVILMTNTSGSLNQTIEEWFHYISTRPDLVVKSPLFFYNWYPNTITVQRNYNRVLFPDCYEIKDNPLCDFEVNQLSKMVWAKLKTHASLVYQLVNRFKFPESDLVNLLKEVKGENSNDDILFEIACNWVKENEWLEWVEGSDVKQQLVIPGLYALYGKWVPDDLINVSLNRVSDLNKRYFENSCYELVLDIRNLSCVEDLVLKEYLQYSSSSNSSAIVVAYLAAVCSDSLESTLKVSTFQKRIVVTSTADSPNFGNVTQYKYFFRTIPSMHLQKTLLLSTFREWNWKQIAILRKDSMFFDAEFFEKNGIKVLEDLKLDESVLTFATAFQALKRIRDQKNGRIFIVEYFEEATRLIMCAAYKLQMTLENGFVWLLNPWMSINWNQHRTDNCTKEEIINVTKSHFILAHRGLITYGDYRILDNENSQDLDKPINQNPFAVFTVEAIEKIGIAIDKLLKENPSALSVLHTNDVAQKFISFISNVDQQGNRISEMIQGYWVLLATIGETRFPVLQWRIEHSSFRQNLSGLTTKPVIQIIGQEIKEKLWGKSNNYMPPSDGSQRDDSAECIFGLKKFFGLSCSSTILIFNAIILIPILGMIMFGYCFALRQLRKKHEEDAIKKYYEYLCEELADLDIPGHDVVINRTVGKGHFGTVFGGEARQENQWVMVAVKAISKKLDYYRKYEFLSEAKLMSTLNHENIVKLVGVSLNTSVDMIFLIMEHVSLGDLKNFLNKRRVKSQADASSGLINSRLLTTFARDIAAGLDYLHKNRYVHRDVALRNCLLGIDYRVKMGDFGLARRMARSDGRDSTWCYQSSGYGGRPFRWLPPESLQDGIYTALTDMWAFGVTLFEIVTFATSPYNEYRNDEVIENVINGCFTVYDFLSEEFRKNKISAIIKKCCAYRPSLRYKSMKELKDIFEEDPECVEPSLSDNPQNFMHSKSSCHSNILMSETSQSSHKKLTFKLSKEPSSFSTSCFNMADSKSQDLSKTFNSSDFYNAFVGLNNNEPESPTQTVDRNIPMKSQSVEFIHLANSNGDCQFSSNANNGDQESDLGYVTYKTNENHCVNQETNTSSSDRPTNLPLKLPSNYLTSTTDKTDQFDNTNNPVIVLSDMITKPVTNHSCSLDLSTDTGVSEIECMMDRQSQTPLSSDIPLSDQCIQTSV